MAFRSLFDDRFEVKGEASFSSENRCFSKRSGKSQKGREKSKWRLVSRLLGLPLYGLLLAFVLGGYSSAVFVVSQYLTTGSGIGTQFAVLLIAFSFDPLRRWLEKETDRLLFGGRAGEDKEPPIGRKRGGSRRTLGLVFPWWRP